MPYLYHLRAGSRKEICPACGRKTFTPYIDSEGRVLSETVGLCDRKDHCNYRYFPAQYLRDTALLQGRPRTLSAFGPRSMERRQPTTPVYPIPAELQARTMTRYDLNPLTFYLRNLFAKVGHAEAVERAARIMGVGTARRFGASTIFWLVDPHGRIRDGKIMGYDPQTGRRVKKPRPLFTNVHTILEQRLGGCYNNGTCYFGAHLRDCPGHRELPIWLYESEKAALIMAIYFEMRGHWPALPMATGGCASLNPTPQHLRDGSHPIQALRGRRVVLYPDQGKYDDWEQKARKLEDFCQHVSVADIMERHPDAQPGDGPDDLLLQLLARDVVMK